VSYATLIERFYTKIQKNQKRKEKMKLITGAECVRKMRQAGVFKGKESYFSQLVAKEIIPYHNKKGSPKKWFVLDEVKQAVKEWEDPTRDAQREANEQKRKPGKKAKAEAMIKYLDLTRDIMQKMKPLSLDMFELEEDSDLTEAEIIEINAQNQIIQDMIIFCIDGRKNEDGLTGIIETFNKVDYMQGWIMDRDSVFEIYDGVK
jgi:hypothetical protein